MLWVKELTHTLKAAKWVSNAWKLVKISSVISGFKEAEIILPEKRE